MGIVTIRHKGLRRLYEKADRRGLPADVAAKIERMLAVMDEANEIAELDLFPGWRLHPLRGDLDGFWSLTVSGNWRLIFRFENGMAFDLDLVDYH
jgi:toxin HigB-1